VPRQNPLSTASPFHQVAIDPLEGRDRRQARLRPVNGATLLVSLLEAEGVDVIFGYPGGAIMPFYDALPGSKLTHVLVRHEQGAALAANGYARASGRVGVCVATSGPGAANLLTGVADAMLDSVPLVAITGQVPSAALGTDAFQEMDVLGVFMPVVKHSFLVRRVDDLPEVVPEAFRIALDGRPGPVLIDLPKDVALATPVERVVRPRATARRVAVPSAGALEAAAALIRSARRPVVYGGGGLGMAGAVDEFRRFVHRGEVPTVLTLKGLGALDSRDRMLLGMLGMHGSRAANLAVQGCDLLITVGARFDDRVTGKLDTFAPGACVIHIDIDPAEVGKRRRADVALVGDVKSILDLLPAPEQISAWRHECLTRRDATAPSYDAPGQGVYAPWLLRRMSELLPGDAIVTCDVGQHQMWVAQHCLFSRPERHLSSGGAGTMGFGVPAAMGAWLAKPQSTVVAVSGDGSFLMNVQELATLARYKVPVKILVLDNQALGMVRQWQQLFFEGRFSEVDLSDNPDFGAVAAAFRVPAFSLRRKSDIDAVLREWIAHPGPALLHVPIDPRANVWPLVPPNASNTDMLEDAQ
jgi:acetolactate synthase-1/2/3 large subunit